MKIINTTFLFFLITFLSIFYHCCRARISDNQKDNIAIVNVSDIDHKYDNEVLNQTLQSLIDSLDSRIKVNLGKDYNKYSKIYVGDSISDFGNYPGLYRYDGIHLDSIIFNKKGTLKLNIENKQIHNGKEIKLISSYKEYADFVNSDHSNRVLLAFSRVYLNKKYDEGVFTVDFSCSYNAGSDYTVYVKKENNRWELKRVLETAVR